MEKKWVLGSEASTLSPSFAIHWLCDLGELTSSLPSSGSSSVKLRWERYLSPHVYNICEVSGPCSIRHGRNPYLHFLSKGTDAKRGGRVSPMWLRKWVADPGTKVDELNCPVHAAGPSSHPSASLMPRGCSGPAREVPGPGLSQLEAFRGLLYSDGNKQIFNPMFQSLAAKFWLLSAIGISGLNFSPSWETSVLLGRVFWIPKLLSKMGECWSWSSTKPACGNNEFMGGLLPTLAWNRYPLMNCSSSGILSGAWECLSVIL